MKERLLSRKLWAWVVWTIITVLAVFKIGDLPIQEIISWYGPVTIIWIGAQGAVDAVKKLKETK